MTFKQHTVAVLIPAYNEATQIGGVVKSLPSYVDHVVIVNDASTDTTAEEIQRLAKADHRVIPIDLPENRGVGGALALAYVWARDHNVDIAVTLDGDGQMDPDEMASLIEPIVRGQADYTKGNRLWNPEYWQRIPRVRFLGNAVLSLLTKMASGYWSVVDSQSGYSAAGRLALERIQWDRMYARYGRPNDALDPREYGGMSCSRCASDAGLRRRRARSSMKVAQGGVSTISLRLFRRYLVEIRVRSMSSGTCIPWSSSVC